MIKIGYQGVENSNNHIAAEMFVKSKKMENYIIVPLTSSENVVSELLHGEIDLGIMAVSNSNIGEIKETKIALKDKNLIKNFEVEFPIKHSAFKIDKNLQNSDVEIIASHEAALEQCKNNIKERYPNAKTIPIKNTAIGPIMLVSGELETTSVVLCPPKAGEDYKLIMDIENLSDNPNNVTTFGVFELNS